MADGSANAARAAEEHLQRGTPRHPVKFVVHGPGV